jgi:NAD(P)-dependent dehydrogenase (short-subunit alcohol dehydrogenase family)
MAKGKGCNFRLDGKSVFIAGAGGIGSAIARGVSEAGAKVFLADLDLAAAEKVAGTIQKKKRPCRAYKMDILDPAQIIQATRFCRLNFGGMDVAINCTGINIRKPSLNMTGEDWDRVLDVNLKGAFFFAQCAAWTFIQQRRRGKIIALASILSFFGMEDRAAYVASKTGLVGLTKALAVEWAPYNINVNAVAPTFIPTSINRETLAGDFKERILDRTPFRRLGKAQDVVGAVIFLSSDVSNFITGHTIPVDGGWLSA